MNPDRILKVGGVLLALGMVLSLIAMSPLVFGGHLASVWWFLAMLTGTGLICIIVGIKAASRARTRAVQSLKGI
jgi:hypothetical protein